MDTFFGRCLIREASESEVQKFLELVNAWAEFCNEAESDRNSPLPTTSFSRGDFLFSKKRISFCFKDRDLLFCADVGNWSPWVLHGRLISPFTRAPLDRDQVTRVRIYGQEVRRSA